ncbi:MAG: hypothetical protein JO256_13275 [Alphaproteobacteria bacterium]|nr:hypothetical protein [Alphaproteobacteria bacterium]
MAKFSLASVAQKSPNCTGSEQIFCLNEFAGLHGFVAGRADGSKCENYRPYEDKVVTRFHPPATGLRFNASIETERSIPMSTQNRIVAIVVGHSEIANTAFQVVTIAVMALFSFLAVLHTAAQLV